MKNIKFSIVVVTYNPGENLLKTLSSIYFQTYQNIEIILKDGLSSDGVVESLEKNDKLKVIIKKDSGIYDAMNQAVAECTGDYVVFINSGDCFYDSSVLLKVFEEINRVNDYSSIYYGDDFYSSRKIFDKNRLKNFNYCLMYKTICHQSIFFPKHVFEVFKYDDNFRFCADQNLYIKCYKTGLCNLNYMEIVVSNYQGGGASDNISNRRQILSEKRLILKNNFSAWEKIIIEFKKIVRCGHIIDAFKTTKCFSDTYENLASRFKK